MINVILHLRAWYWEVRCFNYWLRRKHLGCTDTTMAALDKTRIRASSAAMHGHWIPL